MPFSIYALLGVPSASASSKDTHTNTNTQNLNSPTAKFDPAHNNTFDPSHKFVTSPIRPFSSNPFWLAGVRVLVATYIWFVILVTLIWKSVRLHQGASYFSYFTYLTYIGLCAYYTSSAYHTLAYALRWKRRGAGAGYPLQAWGRAGSWAGRVGQAMYVVLGASVVTFPILVTIVFWSLLASPDVFADEFSSFSNISVHALNSLFALFEILLTNSPPPPWIALPFMILILGAYVGVAYITKAEQGFYVYPFLNPSTQHAKLAAYIVGIALAECIIFVIIHYVMVLREGWAVKRHRVLVVDSAGVVDEERGGGGIGRDEEEWEQIESPNTFVVGGSSPTKSARSEREEEVKVDVGL